MRIYQRKIKYIDIYKFRPLGLYYWQPNYEKNTILITHISSS